MDKKTKIIVIAAVAVVVIGGLYYGYNRWRQQQIANQIIKQITGGDTTGLLGKIIGGGSGGLSDQMAKEMAKEAAEQKAEEAKEAAKTPEDRYNETKAIASTGEISPVMTNEIEPALKAVFGKAKMIAYGTGYTMVQGGSFGATFKVPRVVAAEDLSKLSSEFKNKGYTVMASDMQPSSGSVMLMKDEAVSITFSYNDSGEDQEIEVLYWKVATE